MNVELLDFGWEHSINMGDAVSGNVDLQKFKLSGFRVFGNDVLDYFYSREKLHLYPNLFNFTHFSAHWYKTGIEYTLEVPLHLHPWGSYISEMHGPNIEFRPVEFLPVEKHSLKQKELRERVGRVFHHEVEGAVLRLPANEFLFQLRAAVPELTTMLNLIVTGDIKHFENSDTTDSLLLNSYKILAETGKI